jgi:hypothetical protein
VIAALVAVVTASCRDETAPEVPTGPDPTGPDPTGPGPTGPGPAARFIVSNPAATTIDPSVYVSIRPGTFPHGLAATITNARTAERRTDSLVAGGLDPVPIGAVVGDTIEVVVDASGAQPVTSAKTVPESEDLVVVRTEPSNGTLGVPLRTGVTIVFSEPLDAETVTGETTGLRHAGVAVCGSVAVSPDALTATFTPSADLLPATDYTIVVGAVRGSDGGPFHSAIAGGFWTGTVTRPPSPDSFPPVPADALTYVRATEQSSSSGARSRYVLYANGTFALQYLTSDYGFFEYTGRYSRADTSVRFDFDANAPLWYATGTILGDSLIVAYNLDMGLSDFEDGVYLLSPLTNPEPVPGPTEIYIADADGSKLRFLVTGERPAWSPDGRRIAFQRGGNVHVIGADGTGEALLGEGREPSWAPDGARLAFVGSEGIAVMRDDGSEAVTLLRHDFRKDTDVDDMGVGKPAWSPDGERIAFEDLGDGDFVPAQIFVMKADGSEPRQVTQTQGGQYAESDPAWSPDGSEIVLWSYGYGIAAVPAAGGKPRRIYENLPAVAYGAKPVWSPDGNTILFTANRFGSQAPAIWVVPAQGGAAQPFIEEAADPAWSPDGASIAFGRPAVGSSRSASRLESSLEPDKGLISISLLPELAALEPRFLTTHE